MFRIFDKINNDKVYVIAEMSANHGGCLDTALEIVRQAAKAGADCLKIQTYTADSMTIDCDSDLFLIKGGLWNGYKLYDLYKEACTPYEWQKKIKEECEKCGIDFLSTPFDKNAVDFLEKIGVDAYKVASFELVDIPLIEYIASKGKPVIISCGMGSIQEIEDAVRACKSQGNEQIVLLKCCSEYPANWDDMYLGNIKDMRERFGTIVGLSDHSKGSIGAVVGVALGACVIEKHIKIDGIKSVDSEFSMSVNEFSSMVNNIKIAKAMSKGPSYELSKKEASSKVFRRSIFAVNDMKEGEVLSEDNIRVIRPSNGIAPKYYQEILGKCTTRIIKRGEPIQFDDIKDFSKKEIKDEFSLRDIDENDINLLYSWANDDVSRKNAFHTEYITFDEHRIWFYKLLRDSNQKQYIFMKIDKPIGQIRFSIVGNEAEIDYSISPNERGFGYGKIMLELAKEKFHEEYPNVKKIIGRVKVTNLASEKCFKKNDFKEIFRQYEFKYEG